MLFNYFNELAMIKIKFTIQQNTGKWADKNIGRQMKG